MWLDRRSVPGSFVQTKKIATKELDFFYFATLVVYSKKYRKRALRTVRTLSFKFDLFVQV